MTLTDAEHVGPFNKEVAFLNGSAYKRMCLYLLADTVIMLLIEYIETHYGCERGNKANFLRDNPSILPQELNRWINAELKVNLETGEIYKPTSKRIKVADKKSVSKISSLLPETNFKLESCAGRAGMSADGLINALLDDEIERNQILNAAKNKVVEGNTSNTPVQLIAEIVNRHFSELTHSSEICEYIESIERLVTEMLDRKLLSFRVPENCIAESQRLHIPRVAYYWYGGVIADRVAKILGTWEVYLWHEILASESEVVFIGAPNNVVTCYLVCDRICKLLKKTKSAYKKDQGGWGSKAEIEDAANNYIYRFSQGIMESEIYLYDEDSQMRLIEYASDKYSYAMR